MRSAALLFLFSAAVVFAEQEVISSEGQKRRLSWTVSGYPLRDHPLSLRADAAASTAGLRGSKDTKPFLLTVRCVEAEILIICVSTSLH